MKFKEIEELVKKELLEEDIAKKKELLKERLREIRDVRRILARLEKQYQEFLDQETE